MTKRNTILLGLLLILGLMPLAGCSDLEQETAPVELVATSTQSVDVIDILSPPGTVGTINLQAILKRTEGNFSTQFKDVKLEQYRVSYRRTDGGTLIPAPLIRATSGIVPATGVPTPLNDFFILSLDQLTQAPFVALLPQNGGRDPETGRSTIRMQVVIDVFGETLEGDDVSARTIQEFTFCAGCS